MSPSKLCATGIHNGRYVWRGRGVKYRWIELSPGRFVGGFDRGRVVVLEADVPREISCSVGILVLRRSVGVVNSMGCVKV